MVRFIHVYCMKRTLQLKLIHLSISSISIKSNISYIGSPMYTLKRLQNVQNSADRLSFQWRKQKLISPLLMSRHWLPINARI